MQAGPVSDAGLTVAEVLDKYLDEHVVEKVVAKDRQEYGARHIKLHLGMKRLGEVTIPVSREYRNARQQEGAANSTIRRELNILRAAANHGLRWRHVRPEHAPQIELPDIPASEQVEWFTKDQVATMFRACNAGRLACFIRIAYFTAARRNSIERLLKSQIDLRSGVIHLALPGEKVTKKRRPSVPLYPEIRPAVDWLFEHSGTKYLFGAQTSFYRPFAKLCTSLGFEGHPHMLRHSRATHMLHDGESIYKVAKLLGDSVATVERVYGHSSIQFLQTQSGVESAGMGL